MAETNKIYQNLSPTMSNNQQFRLNRINEIRYYFIAEIEERELMSKKLSKYIASSVTTGTICTASFATVIGAPVGIVSANFSLAFSIST